jgi:glucose-fructose oxidoreductase
VEAIRRVQDSEIGPLRLVTNDHGRILDPDDPADQWRMVKSRIS